MLIPTIPNLHEQLLAARFLQESAAQASRILDSFATWVLAGAGVLLGVAHHELAPGAVHVDGRLIFAAAAATVVQKYLGAIVTAGAQGVRVSREALAQHTADLRGQGQPVPQLNLDAYIGYVRAAMLPWHRRLADRWVFEKLERGDLVAGARVAFRIAQIQGLIVLVGTLGLLYELAAVLTGP
jgi:hypothetical protein